ncbi:hypothetical protein F7725_011228 [Dissostichus mawsoni]|uniref:Uncharacterized protein n=1 Tax=Dissostichus mawsoni TaxID=36200 RepID=A0A7J5ZBI5_DISMA|nr:hypothetical protein F7725_011228 [Dissostichus mawsoni]
MDYQTQRLCPHLMKGLEMARTVRMNHVGQLMPGIFLRGVAPFRRPDESLSSSLSPGRRFAVATGVSSGHKVKTKLVAVVDELERVRLIRSLHVVYVDVQVVRCFQKLIREHGALALIQGQVHVGGDQRAALTLSHGCHTRISHAQSKHHVSEWANGGGVFFLHKSPVRHIRAWKEWTKRLRPSGYTLLELLCCHWIL